MSLDGGIRIPILQGRSDYHEWKFKMRSILLVKGRLVWQTVTGEAAMPTTSTTSKAYKDWEAAGDQALCILFQGLRGDHLTLVCHLETAFEVWETLEKLLGKPTSTEIFAMQEELYEVTKGKRSTDDYLTWFFSRQAKLEYYDSGLKPRHLLLLKIMNGLHPKSDPVRPMLDQMWLEVQKEAEDEARKAHGAESWFRPSKEQKEEWEAKAFDAVIACIRNVDASRRMGS